MSEHDLSDVVERLVADATPVRRLASPGLRVAGWAGAVAVLAAAVTALAGVGARHASAWFAIEVAALATAALLAALAALRSVVPGLAVRVAAAGAAGALAVALAAMAIDAPLDVSGSLASFVDRARGCALKACLLGLAPWLLLLVAARRGVALAGGPSSALVAAAAWLSALALLRVLCPVDDLLHLGLGHDLAALGAVALAWLAGAAVFRAARPSVP